MLAIASLFEAVERVNEAHFWGRLWAADDRDVLARWIASRQGGARAYRACLFAPTEADRETEVRTFTGEPLRSDVGRRHILGEEAARALRLLDAPLPEARDAVERASEGMADWLAEGEAVDRAARRAIGVYCCGQCTVSAWRHMAAGGMSRLSAWLEGGLAQLSALRAGDGAWRRFPFWYTVLALSEIEQPGAHRELQYAAPRLERVLKRTPADELYAQRRRALAERVLTQV